MQYKFELNVFQVSTPKGNSVNTNLIWSTIKTKMATYSIKDEGDLNKWYEGGAQQACHIASRIESSLHQL